MKKTVSQPDLFTSAAYGYWWLVRYVEEQHGLTEPFIGIGHTVFLDYPCRNHAKSYLRTQLIIPEDHSLSSNYERFFVILFNSFFANVRIYYFYFCNYKWYFCSKQYCNYFILVQRHCPDFPSNPFWISVNVFLGNCRYAFRTPVVDTSWWFLTFPHFLLFYFQLHIGPFQLHCTNEGGKVHLQFAREILH